MKWINNVSALQAFQIMRFGTLILIGVVLVKADFQLEDIGSYELFFFLANVMSFFWAMGLNNALISFYPQLEPSRQKQLFFNLGLILLVLGLVAGFELLILEPVVANVLGLPGRIDYIWLIVLYVILSAPSSFTEYYYLLRGYSTRIVSYGVVIFSIQFLLISIGVYCGLSIHMLLVLMVIWAALKFLWFSYVTLSLGEAKLDWALISTFVLFGFPLMLQMLLGNGMEYVDGFLVTHFFDEATFLPSIG